MPYSRLLNGDKKRANPPAEEGGEGGRGPRGRC